jgi:Zinc-binding dehydrogenase
MRTQHHQPASRTQSNAGAMKAIVQSRYGTEPETVLRLGEIGRPAIDRSFVLGDVPAAIRYVHEGRAQGKVVISL